MAFRYEIVSNDGLALSVLDLLESSGHIRQVFESEAKPKVVMDDPYQEEYAEVAQPKFLSGLASYTAAGYTLEVTIEKMAKDILGACEDRKKWEKSLRNVIKEYGHDEILEAFYNWATAQGVYIGRSPVSHFLKNPSMYTKPARVAVSNPNLDKAEKSIAYTSDNLVIFTGDYRVRLAALVNEFGVDLVTRAFKDFYATVDEKGRPWAARDFLLKASVMISTIQRKQAEALKQKQAVEDAIAAAKDSVEDVEEEGEL